ncbi:MAG TPA: ComEC/Rec2 family competence protein [Sphingomicrobium sp.]
MQWTSAPNIGEAPLPQRARGYWKTRFSAAHGELEKLLERERAQLPLWSVVGFGSGIAVWFTLNRPWQWQAFLCLALAASLFGFGLGKGRTGAALGWFAMAAAIGCGLVWVRANAVAAPRLARVQIASIVADVRAVDPLVARETVRLTLHPRTPGLPPIIRVNVRDEDMPVGLRSGAVVSLRARLMPPPPMTVPGSHDFARDFWFAGIGASGRSFGRVQVLRPAAQSGIESLRNRLDQHIRKQLPGPSGTIATAFATGNQNAISEEDADAMRRGGIAHLLSVGGLHITAVIGLTMFLTLRILALSEFLALRLNLLVIAAGAGAVAAIGYTLLTGSQVPMVRSCIVAVLVLAGMALGREAISLRLLAVSGLLILALQPEAIVGPSFQMTFAAVGAIIALHSSRWAQRWFQRRDEHRVRRIVRAAAGLVVTGAAVELCVMPFVLFHFHRAGAYGVFANVLAIPLTELLIMPLEALSLFLDCFGIGQPAWAVTGWTIDLLLGLAHTVAAHTRLITVPQMPGIALGLLTLGLLWICLWTTRMRALGLLPAVIGALLTLLAPRPDLLVTGDGRHLAVVSSDGTPLILRERAGDYVRSLFAEASGFDGDPAELGAMPFSDCSDDACVALLPKNGKQWRLLATRSAYRIGWEDLTGACADADIAVSDRTLPKACKPNWLKLDARTLSRSGGVAVYLGSHPRVDTVADRIGSHPWAQAGPSWCSRPRVRCPRDQ